MNKRASLPSALGGARATGEEWRDETTMLRLGRYQAALADVTEVDAVIVDAPYSARTHGGQKVRTPDKSWHALQYDGWSPSDVRTFCAFMLPRCKSWFVSITDDRLAPVWRACFAASGRFDFAPVPWIDPTRNVRKGGDGPASSTCYIMACRPRERRFLGWGSLPGYYIARNERASGVRGAKPLALMRALVRDYTRPGDLVCDPCAGGGTTLRACQVEGRRSIGAEIDPKTFEAARKRLASPYTRALQVDAPNPPRQSGLF